MKINKDLIIEGTDTSLENLPSEIINNLEPVILYDGGTTGTNGSVTLNDDWTNYKYIEIFYTRAEYEIGSTKAPTDLASSNGLYLNATCCYYGYGTGFWIGWKRFKFLVSDTKSVTVEYGNAYVTASNSSLLTNADNTIKVLKILGYK